jgi:hypothetical protein
LILTNPRSYQARNALPRALVRLPGHLIFESPDYANFVTGGYNVSEQENAMHFGQLSLSGLYSNFSRKCNERILMKDVGHENVIGLPETVAMKSTSPLLSFTSSRPTIIRTLFGYNLSW